LPGSRLARDASNVEQLIAKIECGLTRMIDNFARNSL